MARNIWLQIAVWDIRRVGFPGSYFLLVTWLFLLGNISYAEARREGVYHPVGKGVTLYRISLVYKVTIARLMEANLLSSPAALQAGQKLFIPGAKRVLPVEPSVPLSPLEKRDLEVSLETKEPSMASDDARKTPPGDGIDNPPWLGKKLDIIWPIQGKINSPFGLRGKKLHAGIDIASPSYQEVKAAMDGEVILARRFSSGYGNGVVLRHDRGFTTIYGHMNVLIAQEGEAVHQGQAIGGAGSTGRATGPHLHFEVRYHGRPVDPLPLLPLTIEDLLSKASGKESPGIEKK